MDGQDQIFRHDSRSMSESADAGALPASDLIESVTRELVNRLVQQRQSSASVTGMVEAPTDREIDDFCTALTQDSGTRASGMFDDLRAGGKTSETICLGYIASAARRLGELWCSDDLGFLEVTLGLVRLHAMQREMQMDLVPRGVESNGLSALLAPVPTETHVLGVVMAAGFFRRAGWAVDVFLEHDQDPLVAVAESGKYDLIGLSAGCRAVMPELQAIVPRLRELSPRPKIALGGFLTQLEPGIASELHVDGDLTDITTAPFSYQRMLTSVNAH